MFAVTCVSFVYVTLPFNKKIGRDELNMGGGQARVNHTTVAKQAYGTGQQGWLNEERAGQGDAHPPAATDLGGLHLAGLVEAQPRKDLGRARPGRAASEPWRLSFSYTSARRSSSSASLARA